MNGADALIETLADNDVTVCFANPGTSEMQFVSALDREPRMRSILCLFEGVATGAADGYARMARHPACTLLHLGPGYANGAANLHNARRALSPVINVIGDHATYHRELDAPLNSDIATLASPNSAAVLTAETADDVGPMASMAIEMSLTVPNGVVSLILPADSAWNPTRIKGPRYVPPELPAILETDITAAAEAIKAARKPVILLGSAGCLEDGLAAAGRLTGLGVRILTDTFTARQSRGAGRFLPDKMMYFGEAALEDLAGVDLMVLAGTVSPAAFFAYPDRPGLLVPEGCKVITLAGRNEDTVGSLVRLADTLKAQASAPLTRLELPDLPTGRFDAHAIGASIARHMPDASIISDDAVTAGLPIFMATRKARAHEWLSLTGGAIGQGMPVAIGAAVACPDRKVLCLSGDGSAMYTVQSLWTIAREKLDVTVVIFANHAYRILNIELGRTGAGNPGPAASRLLDLGDPRIDWVSLAQGLGVSAVRCDSSASFDSALKAAMETPGPHFIEAAL